MKRNALSWNHSDLALTLRPQRFEQFWDVDLLKCDAKNVSSAWLWDSFLSLIKVSKKNMGKFIDAMIVAQQLKQKSQALLHAGEEDVSLAAF